MSKLFWRYGAMGAGKSIALLSVAHNYARIGRKVELFTAQLDDRFGAGKVASRLGISMDARAFTPATVFTREMMADDAACVLVDEAQFLTAVQVEQLHRLAALGGLPVICYGLRSDFMGRAFEGAAALGILADQIEELKTVCACGRKATFNMRLDGAGQRVREGAQVQIGGDETYRQTCPVCFYGA